MTDPHDFLPFLQMATVVLYLWFARQCVAEYRLMKTKTAAAKTFLALAIVFGLCALSGYLFPFVAYTLGFEPVWFVWGHVAIHAALPVAALTLIMTNAAHFIIRALDHGGD